MYRILQSLEREPISQHGIVSDKRETGADDVSTNDKNATRRNNPHKYLLYRPSFSQLMLYIATAFKVFCNNFFTFHQDISDGSALLVYLSADGAKKISKGDHEESGIIVSIIFLKKVKVTKAEFQQRFQCLESPLETLLVLRDLLHLLRRNLRD
jgi:hypothetical protein